MKCNVYWSPQPKQALALKCPATELFYGGAAGGGKSDFLLGDFLQGAERYGKRWKGILFRQTTTELEELQARAEELYKPLGAVYCGTGTKSGSNMWKFPNGATLKMRYLENEKDVKHYQGHQYTWVGIDELGNYPSPYCWTYMKSRLRSVYGVPCYIRGTANPGGVGHGWIKQRFMDGKVPNRIFYIETKLGNIVSRDTACFIPSSLDDNKILMENDPEYEARLLSLPSQLARALRYGDWSVFEGQVLDSFRENVHVCKPFALEQGKWFRFCTMDWGWSRPYSIGFYAVNSLGQIVRYRELYGCKEGEYNVGVKKSAKALAEEAWQYALIDGIKDMVADPAIWTDQKIEDESKSIAQVFTEVGFNMVKANNDRVNGLVMVDDIFKQTVTTGVDENGNPIVVPMFQVFNTCTAFIRTIPTLTPNPNHPEDIDTDLEDHAYDDHRYGMMSDFVAHPMTHLRKINGSWRQQKKSKEWEPSL